MPFLTDEPLIRYLQTVGLADPTSGVLMPGARIRAGSGVSAAESYAAGVEKVGSLFVTRIVVDLTGLAGSTTDLDIIGNSAAANAHIGQITAAANGTIVGGRMTCLELPVTGVTDIDLYASNVGTGTESVIITDAALGTETALVTAGGVWTNGAVKGFTGVPAANDYLYLTNGAAGTPGTYTGGKFLIELFGK